MNTESNQANCLYNSSKNTEFIIHNPFLRNIRILTNKSKIITYLISNLPIPLSHAIVTNFGIQDINYIDDFTPFFYKKEKAIKEKTTNNRIDAVSVYA